MGGRWRRGNVSKPSNTLVLGRLTIISSTCSHYEDQLLTATILVSSKDSMKELGSVTMNYSQLLTHAEVRSKG